MKFTAKFAGIATAACVMALAGAAQAATIVGLYNTGAGVPLGTNGLELNWTLDGGTAYVGGTNGQFPLNGPWLTEDATSRWIGPTVTAGESTDPRNDGFYEYNLSFTLTGGQAASASFLARFAADNGVSWVRLNGDQLVDGTVTPVGGYNAWTGFGANSGFVAGQNNLTIRVVNFSQDGGNPSGLRVEFTDSNAIAVPEPASWALMIVGFGAAGVMVRRSRRVALTA